MFGENIVWQMFLYGMDKNIVWLRQIYDQH